LDAAPFATVNVSGRAAPFADVDAAGALLAGMLLVGEFSW
jgi:hypothetical protein